MNNECSCCDNEYCRDCESDKDVETVFWHFWDYKNEKYINKKQIIIWLNKKISICLCDSLKEAGKLTAYYKILEFIESGEFNNDNL